MNDFTSSSTLILIFCDGDFWHGNVRANHNINTNADYWNEKIKRNIERDLENTIELRDAGWSVLRFWGSDIIKNIDLCFKAVLQEIKSRNFR